MVLESVARTKKCTLGGDEGDAGAASSAVTEAPASGWAISGCLEDGRA
uniref:Uncharacterized protein n=1 Tax=Arundo donax TaxID=35708 RepID=A0A0A9DD59_ARUDO